jgi:hypothetical protein
MILYTKVKNLLHPYFLFLIFMLSFSFSFSFSFFFFFLDVFGYPVNNGTIAVKYTCEFIINSSICNNDILRSINIANNLDKQANSINSSSIKEINYTTFFSHGSDNIVKKSIINNIPKEKIGSINEPSVASKGNLIFYVGNYYAARSIDGGQTWEFLDPSYDFENMDNPQIHKFCCDQKVIYDQQNNIFIWYRQGEISENISRAINSTANKVTIGISNDTYSWNMYNIYADEVNLGNLKEYYQLDFPELSLGNKFLYITSNLLYTPLDSSNLNSDVVGHSNSSAPNFATIFRIPLDQLSNNNFTSYEVRPVAHEHVFVPIQSPSDILYWATLNDENKIIIYSWSEADNEFFANEFNVMPYYKIDSNGKQCDDKEFAFWCIDMESIITAGWKGNNTVGFLWNAAHPFVKNNRTVYNTYIDGAIFELNEDGSINSESYKRTFIINPNYSWLMSSTSPNNNGTIGMVSFYGNNKDIPIGVAFGKLINSTKWDMMSLINSTSKLPIFFENCNQSPRFQKGCTSYLIGDFLTIRPNFENDNHWDIAAYIFNGTREHDVIPYYFVTK